MRILIVGADPTDQNRLQLGREQTEIEEVLLKATRRHLFDVKVLNAATIGQLSDRLMRYKPHVLHFAGHGRATHIALQDDDGKSVVVNDKQLTRILLASGAPLRCVVLNSCFSVALAGAVTRVGAVAIGTDGAIGDRIARLFSRYFYQALFARLNYQIAYDMAVADLGNEVDSVRFHIATAEDGKHTGHLPRSGLSHRWDVDGADHAIVGREQELSTIVELLEQPTCNLIAVHGAAGIGKTTLTAAVNAGGQLSSGVETAFITAYEPIWISLVNVPDLHTVAESVIGAGGEPGALLSTEDDVTRLISLLGQRRYLLILDNFESVLAADDRAEEYGRLLSAVAERPLRSCVLLTSRQLPAIADPSRRRSPHVHDLHIRGMSGTEIREIVDRDTDLTGSNPAWEELATLFGGNPLSIILAARHIAEVYNGDIRSYLNSEVHTFRAVEELLDWHLDRLEDDEYELAQWLTVQRQPAQIADLLACVSSHTRQLRLGDTLQRLMRALPVHSHGAAVLLQPVLIERICERIANNAADDLLANASRTLDRVALLQATATEPVRRGQHSALLGRVIDLCHDTGMTSNDIARICRDRLTATRSSNELGYLAGNLVNLLIAVGAALKDVTLSNITIRQADFRTADLRAADLSAAHLRECRFRDAFGSILTVRLSSDGQLLAAGGADGKVRLWNVATGESQAVIAASQKWVRSVDFAPNCDRLVVAADDNTVRSWSLDGSRSDEISVHGDWVMTVRCSRDGRFVASAGNDRRVVLRFADGSEATHELHDTRIRCLSISSDDQLVVSGDESGTAIIWNVADSVEIHRFTCGSAIRGIAFANGDTAVLAATEAGALQRWELADRAFAYIEELHNTPIRSLAYRDVNDQAVTAAESGEIAVITAGDGDVVRRLTGHGKRLQSVDIGSADLCASGGEDQAIRVWNLHNGVAVRIFTGYANPAWSCAWSRNGHSVFIGYEDGWLRTYDRSGSTAPSRELQVLTARLRTICLTTDPAMMAVVAGDDRRLVALDHDGQRIAEGTGHVGRVTALISAANQLLSASGDGTIRAWTRSRTELGDKTVHSEPEAINCLVSSPDGRLIAFGGDARHVRVMELASRRLIVNEELPDRVWSTSFTSAGNELYVGCGNGHVYRIGINAPSPPTGFRAHDGWVWSVHTCPGGLLTSGEDGLVKSWTTTPEPVPENLITASSRVRVVSLSPTGDSAAAICDDGTAWIWDLAERKPTRTVRPGRPYEGLIISAQCQLEQGTVEALRALGANVR